MQENSDLKAILDQHTKPRTMDLHDRATRNDVDFLNHCALWANANLRYDYEHEPSDEGIRLLTAIQFTVWGDKEGIKNHQDKYSRTFDNALFEHAYGEIFTRYRWCDNSLLPQPIQTIFHKPGHITQTFDYEPHISTQVMTIACPILIGCFLLLSPLAALHLPWLAPICCLAIIIIFSIWWRNKQLEIKWKAEMSIAIALWGKEVRNLMKSPAFLSWACYKYQTEKLNHQQKVMLRNFICSHPLWLTEPPSSSTP